MAEITERTLSQKSFAKLLREYPIILPIGGVIAFILAILGMQGVFADAAENAINTQGKRV